MAEDHFLNLQPGTIVNGRYEVVKCLGTGSMGMVYACRHRELSGHLVAMKVLFSEVAKDEVAAARFRNEIVASYGVSHPNVVRAYEYFRDGDLIAYTMEFVGGGDLADRIGMDEPMEIKEIVRMLCQMCGGVQAIHDAGIIHRDLKPENLLLTEEGNIKITDFGIARTGTGPKLTEHGGVVGTIDYVSPEYLEKGQVDHRSDIYALGVLAYEMLTGESPYKGNSVIETMTLRLKTDPKPVTELRSDCPLELNEAVLKAMKRNVDDRYQSAREMLHDLELIAKNIGLSVVSSQSKEKPVIPAASSVESPMHDARNRLSTETLSLPSRGNSSRGETQIDARGNVSVTPAVSEKPVARKEPREEKPTAPRIYVSGRDSDSIRRRESAEPQVTRKPSNSMSASAGLEDSFKTKTHFPSQKITISQSKLSTERIQELSSSFYEEGESWLRVLKYALYLIGGFIFTILIFYLINSLFPGVLGRKHLTLPGYIQSE